jgi:hypothetical protein
MLFLIYFWWWFSVGDVTAKATTCIQTYIRHPFGAPYTTPKNKKKAIKKFTFIVHQICQNIYSSWKMIQNYCYMWIEDAKIVASQCVLHLKPQAARNLSFTYTHVMDTIGTTHHIQTNAPHWWRGRLGNFYSSGSMCWTQIQEDINKRNKYI